MLKKASNIKNIVDQLVKNGQCGHFVIFEYVHKTESGRSTCKTVTMLIDNNKNVYDINIGNIYKIQIDNKIITVRKRYIDYNNNIQKLINKIISLYNMSIA